jgi:hypothetical protein
MEGNLRTVTISGGKIAAVNPIKPSIPACFPHFKNFFFCGRKVLDSEFQMPDFG